MGEDMLAALATEAERSAKESVKRTADAVAEGKRDIIEITMVAPRIDACLEPGATMVSVTASELTVKHDPSKGEAEQSLLDANLLGMSS